VKLFAVWLKKKSFYLYSRSFTTLFSFPQIVWAIVPFKKLKRGRGREQANLGLDKQH